MEPRLYTTIKIKRRVSGEPGPPPFLSHGELAFNEVNNTMYIGTSSTESFSSDENEFTDLGTF